MWRHCAGFGNFVRIGCDLQASENNSVIKRVLQKTQMIPFHFKKNSFCNFTVSIKYSRMCSFLSGSLSVNKLFVKSETQHAVYYKMLVSQNPASYTNNKKTDCMHSHTSML